MYISENQRGWLEEWDLGQEPLGGYIQLIPEELSLGIFTDIGCPLGPINSPLPTEIWKELEQVIAEWEPYYSMSNEELMKSKKSWLAIEQKSIELAKKISRLIGLPIKYVSPGFRQTIDIS